MAARAERTHSERQDEMGGTGTGIVIGRLDWEGDSKDGTARASP
jgi:hypothetical protein